MSIEAVSQVALPEDLKKELELFCQDLITLLQEDLGAIILYGGVAKEEFESESSDINLMLILKKINQRTAFVAVIRAITTRKLPKISFVLFLVNGQVDARIIPACRLPRELLLLGFCVRNLHFIDDIRR